MNSFCRGHRSLHNLASEVAEAVPVGLQHGRCSSAHAVAICPGATVDPVEVAVARAWRPKLPHVGMVHVGFPVQSDLFCNLQGVFQIWTYQMVDLARSREVDPPALQKCSPEVLDTRPLQKSRIKVSKMSVSYKISFKREAGTCQRQRIPQPCHAVLQPQPCSH